MEAVHGWVWIFSRIAHFSAVSQTDFSPDSVVQARLQGFWVKIAIFSPLYCIAIRKRYLSTKKTKPNNNRK